MKTMIRRKKIISILLSVGFFLFVGLKVKASLPPVVELVVKVYDKDGKFVETLKSEDFTILDGGTPQQIAAFYAIKNGKLIWSEEKDLTVPSFRRTLFLQFRLYSYFNKLGKGIETFISQAITPSDTLKIMTPAKSYTIRKEAFLTMSRKDIASKINAIVRKDLNQAASRYKELTNDLKLLSRSLRHQSGFLGRGDPFNSTYDIRTILDRYENDLKQLHYLTGVDEKYLISFAKFLKSLRERKYVLIFSQKVNIPTLDSSTYMALSERFRGNASLYDRIQRVFTFSKMPITDKGEALADQFADSGSVVYFVFLTGEKKGEEYTEDFSGGFFSVFAKIAEATGGKVISTTDPEAAFEEVSKEVNNYYLIYYVPTNYKKDGSFRKVEVRIKNDTYKVFHRKGYFSEKAE